MTKKIFISYAKKDARDIALALADALAEVDGLEVWIDRSLRAGRSWELQIQQQIDECDVMIVLYSPDINRHKLDQPESYVLTEIAYAKYTAKKPIIPVMAIQTDPPISLTMEHYIDFAMRGVMDDLIQALCTELEISEVPPKVAVISEKLRESEAAVRAVIGEPFEWCEVPAGEFLYGKQDRPIILESFAVAKYPITYSQFQIFINDNGFEDERWWNGLSYKPNKPGQQKWEFDDHPRENVSWYDAMAFCRWLSGNLRSEYDISRLSKWAVRLPTEFEWEKAARGQHAFNYPWGNEHDSNNYNSITAVHKTSPVSKYPKGESPYGALDMVGNVWEWCLTDIFTPEVSVDDNDISKNLHRILRGGSYIEDRYYANIPLRNMNEPDFRDQNYGFRIMRPL